MAALLFVGELTPACSAQREKSAQTYDLVIAGAGTGGISAAIQAARMGATVALLEETDWIGGQMGAAGVGTMDEGKNLTPPSGLYAEFLQRMEAYYRERKKTVGTCYWQSGTHCFDPSAIRKVLTGMIADANSESGGATTGHIDLLLEDRVVEVLGIGGTVTGVKTAKGKTLQSKVLIDATEFGDVLPLTSVRFRSGHGLGEDSKQQCIQDITYTAVIRKYPEGVPPALRMLHAPPGYDHWKKSFANNLRADGDNQRRKPPVSFAVHNAYRGLPDEVNPHAYTGTDIGDVTRASLNWFNDLPTTTSIFDRGNREKIVCYAKLKTLANLYYIQHELGETTWSVADDEGYDTVYNRAQNSCPEIPQEFKAIEANLPPMPYVRESRRIVGEYTLTAADIRRQSKGGLSAVSFPDAIAVGDYPDDLHGCKAAQDLEPELDKLSDVPEDFRFGPFQVPLAVLIPEKVDGLLAAEKNISQSRFANGATRLQPITMLTGQAAGALAALAVREKKQPRDIPVVEVQHTLLQAGSILARQAMKDVPAGTFTWQAAQFVVLHEWMLPESRNFMPEKQLSRQDEVQAMSALSGFYAAGRRDQKISAGASNSPIPSFAKAFVRQTDTSRAAPLPCSDFTSRDCDKSKPTLNQFLHAVETVVTANCAAGIAPSFFRKGIIGDKDEPVTRSDAATILYNSTFVPAEKNCKVGQ